MMCRVPRREADHRVRPGRAATAGRRSAPTAGEARFALELDADSGRPLLLGPVERPGAKAGRGKRMSSG